MDWFPQLYSPAVLAVAFCVTFFSGAVKGAVGFGMPMIMISGLSLVAAPDLALAILILPTLVSNGAQALRNGHGAALDSIKKFRVFLLVGLLMLLLSAQLVAILPQRGLFLLIGGSITVLTLSQLAGWQLRLKKQSSAAEVALGGCAGFVGGVSGVWGPPTVAYLTAINTPKTEQMRVQGVVYGLGAVALTLAHLQSGILNRETLPISAITVFPAMAGMWFGLRLHDRIDQASFRRITLLVLFFAGLNLLRRGLFG